MLVSWSHPSGSLDVLPGESIQFLSVYPETASDFDRSKQFTFDEAVNGGSADAKIQCHFIDPVVRFLRKIHRNGPPLRC